MPSWRAHRTFPADDLPRPVTIALLALVGAYGLVLAVVWVAQDRLLFYPQPATDEARPPAGWRVEPVRHRTADGTSLIGALLLPPREKPPVVLYYGGNAEEALAFAPDVEAIYGHRAVLLMNYRGYGHSGGTPSERAIVGDALELYDWIAARADLDTAHIALHGRSLGSGVAVQVAAARPACRVVLTSPYDSVSDVASRIYPWLPVRWLARHPFDSAARAPQVRVPAQIFIAENDTLIPPAHSERLAGLWGAPVERVRLPGRGHDDVMLDPRYAPALRGFLAGCDGTA